MNDVAARKQIDTMISFIMQEAKEKARDMIDNTEKEFNADKINRSRAIEAAIKDEFDRKKKERLIAKKIERSRKATEARITKMRERDVVMKQLKDEVLAKLSDVSKNAKYSELLRFLTVQALMTIAENRVILQCRKEDVTLVKGQVDAAVKLYQEYVTTATGVTPKCQIDLANKYLPPGAQPGSKAPSCAGGVVLSARNGTIVCRNTLDSRLDLCFTNLVPTIRGLVFGVRAKAIANPGREAPHH